MCDDLKTTMSELTAKGATCAGKVQEAAWEAVVTLIIPGAGQLGLYEPWFDPPATAMWSLANSRWKSAGLLGGTRTDGLAVNEHVLGLWSKHFVDTRTAMNYIDRSVATQKDEVVAVTCIHVVLAPLGVEEVGSRSTPHSIRTSPSPERVLPITPSGDVVALVQVQPVSVSTASKSVIAKAARHLVIAEPAKKAVATNSATDPIVSWAGPESILA